MGIRGKKILIVEDNEINMEIMADMLNAMGLITEGAEDGRKAIDILAKAQKGEFHAVLMDIHMPVMNGYETTRMIRHMDIPLQNIPVLAMTGDALTRDKEMAIEAGMNGYIAKPVGMEEIVEAMKEFF